MEPPETTITSKPNFMSEVVADVAVTLPVAVESSVEVEAHEEAPEQPAPSSSPDASPVRPPELQVAGLASSIFCGLSLPTLLRRSG